MIPAIGIMVGFYIITRMIEIFQKNSGATFLRIMSIVTIIVVLISMVDILNAGSKVIN